MYYSQHYNLKAYINVTRQTKVLDSNDLTLQALNYNHVKHRYGKRLNTMGLQG